MFMNLLLLNPLVEGSRRINSGAPFLAATSNRRGSLFGWLVADGWCWFVLREEYCWLVAAGCWWLFRSERKVLLAGG
jgi:hypothetical protein